MAGDAGDRLRAAVRDGDLRAARHELAAAADDRERRDDLLDVLAGRASDGCGASLELLVETIDDLGLARRAVRRLLVDETMMDDVAQDTLIAVAESVRSFRGEARFTTWLQAIARRRALDHLRRQRATEPLDDHDLADAERLSSVIASRESAQQLLDRLPAPYRDAVALRDVDRLPYEQVAAQLGRNVSTVRTQVARGRSLLAAVLAEQPSP